jgi:3-phenylpropionate/trans-cinnamate dioxygenase ferredoxin reductase subunit
MGRSIAADAVVICVGVGPADGLTRAAGLGGAGGIEVDDHCRTAISDVYAVGDIAAQFHAACSAHVRTEHWESALEQGRAAAVSILGGAPGPPPPPRYSTEQYGLSLHIAGYPHLADHVLVHGGFETKDFSAVYLARGALVGVLATNRPRDVRASLEMIRSAVRPAQAQLLTGVRGLVRAGAYQ